MHACEVGEVLASNLVCGAYHRPAVAFCLGGNARTFHQPLVHRTARTNFIEAFGGVITVFAALKLGDERGDQFGTPVLGEDDKVIVALKHIGAVDRHDVVGFSEKGRKYSRVVLGTQSLPTDRPPPDRCGVAQAAKEGRTSYILRSMLGQLNNRRACQTLIRQHEEAHAMRFDYVIFRYMLGDQVLMFPRAAMNEVFEACQEDFMIGDLKFEGGNAMIPAQITRKNKPGVSGNKGTRLICEKLNLLPGPSYYKRNFQLAGLGSCDVCYNLGATEDLYCRSVRIRPYHAPDWNSLFGRTEKLYINPELASTSYNNYHSEPSSQEPRFVGTWLAAAALARWGGLPASR